MQILPANGQKNKNRLPKGVRRFRFLAGIDGKSSSTLLAALALFTSFVLAWQASGQDTDDLLSRLLRISKVTEFRWSPSGESIAYISNRSGSPQLFLLSLATGDSSQLTRHSGPVHDPQWSPDGRSLLFLSDPGWQERYELWEYDLETKTTERLLQDGAVIQRNMRWSPDGSRLVLETNASGNFDLAYWSRSDPVLRELVSGPYNEGQSQWSPDGRALLFVAQNALWLMTGEEPPKRLIRPGLGSAIDSPRWSPDGKHILFATDIQGNWDIGIYSFEDEQWTLLVSESHEETAPSWSSNGRQIAFISTQGFGKRLGVLDLANGRINYVTDSKAVCSSPQWNPSGTGLAFLMSSAQRTWDLWLYSDGEIRPLTDSMAGWTADDFSAPQEHQPKNRDGFAIPSLLYQPKGFQESQQYPAIIWIHGGFEGQWLYEFDLAGQFLLQQGMVLFYPNPRGSGGYGRAYERLNDGDWGGGDFDDLSHADSYLRDLPYVDEDRIGLWGGSYGGFLTYTLVARSPGSFSAAVVRAGISDLRAHILERTASPARLNSPLSGYPKELGGLPHQNSDFYRERSPFTWVSQVRTPMLIYHGLKDSRVAPSQSRIWAQALEENGVQVELIEYPGEDHGVSRTQKALADLLRHAASFLERHLSHAAPRH